MRLNQVVEAKRIGLGVATPPGAIPTEDVVLPVGRGVVLLPRQSERLMTLAADAHRVALTIRIALDAPYDGARGIGLEDGGTEVVVEVVMGSARCVRRTR